MNVMSSQGFVELDAHIDTVLGDDNIKGAVITSAKPDFAGGMDLNELGCGACQRRGKPRAGDLRQCDAWPPHPAQDRARRYGPENP